MTILYPRARTKVNIVQIDDWNDRVLLQQGGLATSNQFSRVFSELRNKRGYGKIVLTDNRFCDI